MDRRSFLKLFGAAAAAQMSFPMMRAFAEAPLSPIRKDDAFIVVHASGGWDVTLWSDPRNAKSKGLDPAHDGVVDIDGVKNWTSKSLGDGTSTFELVKRGGYSLGPAMGDLTDMFDRLTIVNGISMETVSHFDGTCYSVTGRHLAGGRPIQTSIDSILAGEIGPQDLLPLVSIRFPSAFVSSTLDARATPLQMASVDEVGKSLSRSNLYTTVDDRNATTMLLADEAAEVASRSYDGTPASRMKLQYQALGKMIADKSLLDVFDTRKLSDTLQPTFFVDGSGKKITRRFHAAAALNAAFAVETIKKGMCRCVSFAATGFDTHTTNYADAPTMYQEFFDVIAELVRQLDAQNLAHRTHIVVISDFCRTPAINAHQGRDHYPNNSALIISPTIKSGLVFGKSDPEQLLPTNVLTGPEGPKPIRPPDVLATLLTSVGVDPRKHLREGDAIPELIK